MSEVQLKGMLLTRLAVDHGMFPECNDLSRRRYHKRGHHRRRLFPVVNRFRSAVGFLRVIDLVFSHFLSQVGGTVRAWLHIDGWR